MSSNVKVALTTTGFLKESGGDEFSETMIWKSDAPVCVVEMGFMMFGDDKEFFEHVIAKSMLEMAKIVFIDIDKKYLFVGENPKKEDTGLVVYEEKDNSNNYASHFFERWQETKSFVIQIHVINMKNIVFSIVGVWANNQWSILEMRPKGNLFIVQGGPFG